MKKRRSDSPFPYSGTIREASPVYAVILAGGASSRFWPWDGDDTPKYLFRAAADMHGKRVSLLEAAFERCRALTSPDRIVVVTGAKQARLIRSKLPALKPANLLIEPARRDTLAALLLANEVIARRDERACVVVTPADSLLTPPGCLRAALTGALRAEAFHSGRLYSFAVKPTRAETGFGYLEAGEPLAPGILRAKRFIEKPDARTARRYLRSNRPRRDGSVRFYWNTGSFAWRATDFLAETTRLHPAMHKAISAFVGLPKKQGEKHAKLYAGLPKLSVDYGVMEHARNVGILALDAEFDDIGTWDALSVRRGPTEGVCDTIQVDSTECGAYMERPHRIVAFVGCERLLVVERGDKLLIMRRGEGQRVKEAAKFSPDHRRAAKTPPRDQRERPSGLNSRKSAKKAAVPLLPETPMRDQRERPSGLNSRKSTKKAAVPLLPETPMRAQRKRLSGSNNRKSVKKAAVPPRSKP